MIKNKLYLSFLFVCTLLGITACGGNDDPINNPPVNLTEEAKLSDVRIAQTINGKQAHQILALDEELTIATSLTFNEKEIKWSNPTLELTIDKLFSVTKENVTVTNSKDVSVSVVTVTVTDNHIKVTFNKSANSYTYLNSQTLTVSIRTKLKNGVSEDEISALNYSGKTFESSFYVETPDKNIKSNSCTITSNINIDILYDVKGDPNNSQYAYQLNVVYFVPNDVEPCPNYRKRISTILLKHQLFVCKWMKYWEYEEKSFGLPLDVNGFVDIVTVNGKQPLSAYTYENGRGLMQPEISAWYADKGLTKHSDHTLIITATKPGVTVDVPFFGSGRDCFAYDYAEMAFENMQIDPITGATIKGNAGITNNSIGGMLHELGHGLNEPHVGPTNSQKNDPAFGMSLMGSGNQTWGKKPTFMHHSSAAIMNNCQISSKTKKTFYGSTTASVKVEGKDVEIVGSNLTLKGNFTADTPVTDVIVRFYKSDEDFLGGASGYNSVAFVVKPESDNTFEATVPIEELRVNSYTDYHIGFTILMNNGTQKSMSLPYTYRQTLNGTPTLTSEDLINDGTWTVTTSHSLPDDAAISNAPGSLVDGDLTTCLSMVKPGKTYGDIAVSATDQVWATINFGKVMEFNEIVLTNRNFQLYLNTQEVSFYGSNDGSTFALIKGSVALPENKVNTIPLDAKVQYRYLKMTFDKWDSSQGSTMQFAELGLKNK